MELDSVYQSLGCFGKFTKLQIILLLSGTFSSCFQLLSNVFIGFQNPHRCARPDNDTALVDLVRGYHNASVVYEQCSIHVLSNDTVIKTEKCMFGTEYDLPIDTSFISTFDLVCESKNLARLTQTLVIAGQGVGAILGSFLSDRLGRKMVVVGSNLGLLVAGLLIAYAQNFVMFAVFKFVAGVFQQTLPSIAMMDKEYSNSKDPQDADTSLKQANVSVKLSYLDMIRNRRLLFNILMIWLAWFTTAFGFFALYLTSTSLAGDKYLNFFLTALMEIPPNIFFYFGLNRFGRRNVLLCNFIALSVGLIGSGIFQSFEQTTAYSTLALLFSMVAMCGASGCFGIAFQYTPELFPTNIRNQALGLSSMIARFGGMLAPFTGILSEKAKWGPGLLIGCLATIVAVLTRFLPETRDRELPQTLEDLQAWFEKDDKNSNGRIKEENSKQNTVL